MPAPLVVSVLALVSLGAAWAPDCKDLFKPFLPEDLSPVYGRWVLVLGAGDPWLYHYTLGSVKNSWISLAATDDSQVVTYRWGDRRFGRCFFASTNATISSGRTSFTTATAVHEGEILKTCPDCLLWSDGFLNQGYPGRYLLLYTRTGKLEPDFADRFKEQAACLHFPEPHVYDGETEMCPYADDSD